MLRIFFLFFVFQGFDLLFSSETPGTVENTGRVFGRGFARGAGEVTDTSALSSAIRNFGENFVFGCGIIAVAGVATVAVLRVADHFFPSPHDRLAIAQTQKIQRTWEKEKLQESLLKDYAACRGKFGCNYHELALQYGISGGDPLVLELVEKEALLSQCHKKVVGN